MLLMAEVVPVWETRSRAVGVVAVLLLFAQPSQACQSPTSPIILDLNGDGVLTSNLMTSPVHFDLNGDGLAEEVAWTSAYDPDAFLWLDRNGNGSADSGRELFGNATEMSDGSIAGNGFIALAEYDGRTLGGNSDGEITAADSVYAALRVWTDRNHDDRVDLGEDRSLSDAHIAVISLRYDRSDYVDGCMNLHRFRSRFVIRDGKRSVSRVSEDVYFQVR